MKLGDQFDILADGSPGEEGRILKYVSDGVAVNVALAAGVGFKAGRNAEQR